jgi:hypothetical protein
VRFVYQVSVQFSSNHDLNLVDAELMIRYANKVHSAKPVQEVESAFRRKVGND